MQKSELIECGKRLATLEVTGFVAEKSDPLLLPSFVDSARPADEPEMEKEGIRQYRADLPIVSSPDAFALAVAFGGFSFFVVTSPVRFLMSRDVIAAAEVVGTPPHARSQTFSRISLSIWRIGWECHEEDFW